MKRRAASRAAKAGADGTRPVVAVVHPGEEIDEDPVAETEPAELPDARTMGRRVPAPNGGDPEGDGGVRHRAARAQQLEVRADDPGAAPVVDDLLGLAGAGDQQAARVPPPEPAKVETVAGRGNAAAAVATSAPASTSSPRIRMN